MFGKTTENIIKHKDIRLVTNRESYLKTVTKPNFKSEIYFSENLMSCKMGKTKVKYAGGGVQSMEKPKALVPRDPPMAVLYGYLFSSLPH